MEEPSVLDYVKAKLSPWKHQEVVIPAAKGSNEPAKSEGTAAHLALASGQAVAPATTSPAKVAVLPTGIRVLPWRSLTALSLAILAQIALEPPTRSLGMGILLYIFSAASLFWALQRGEWVLSPLPVPETHRDPLSVDLKPLTIAVPLALLAFIAFGGGFFTPLNLVLWLLALAFYLRGVWLGTPQLDLQFRRIGDFVRQPTWRFSISRWTLLLLGVFILAAFFRAYHLNQVPPEMNSDHAEKLLDVADVLAGKHRIFFPRNTGREAIQFYLTAAIASLLGTGVSFTSLKIGTITAGLLTLPYIYLLGKEVGNRRIGLLAMAFAGIAYWPNVIARLALRFTLYPFFVAPTLYYLIRGIRRSNRNDFILAGIALGIGLHGYTPIRILPFVVVAAVLLYIVHRQASGVRLQTLLHLGLLSVTSLMFFLPLLRYALDNPEMFAYRTMTRLGTTERPLPGPAWQIFLQNLRNAMVMFGWDNGEVWTVSIPHRPALGIITAGLFYLGLALLLIRYARRRHWLDLFLVVSVPLLMLPSILSLAFPSENPVLSRTGGAIIPVFLIIAIALDGLLREVEKQAGRRAALSLVLVLFVFSAFQNYDLVFRQYYENYRLSAWNSSEMGRVIKDFIDSSGDPNSAWVVGYPYWVDTRLVGMNAGYPTKDYAIFTEDLPSTQADPNAKLFLIKPEDQEAVLALNKLYPQGWLEEYHSAVSTKDFLMFFVPPDRSR